MCVRRPLRSATDEAAFVCLLLLLKMLAEGVRVRVLVLDLLTHGTHLLHDGILLHVKSPSIFRACAQFILVKTLGFMTID